jgi:2-polyprenyl-6-methoxyphenol hydroxylase-like FAD-dependent oxidoreductase
VNRLKGVTCLIAGGGPAGMMCGYLLARAGVDVHVLEKHADFLRDFRGDTIHPSTLTVMDELGLADEFLSLPHQRVAHAEGEIGDVRVRFADFSHLPTKYPFIAFVPQWDFLDFLSRRAKRFSGFALSMNAEAREVIRRGGRVSGLVVETADGIHEIAADLVIAADGRDSTLRAAAGLTVRDLGAPMDVMWFTLPHRPGEDQAVLGRIADGQAMVMLYRGDYWQCALIIRKGEAEAVKREGLDAFRRRVARLARREAGDEIRSLDDVKVLEVRVNRVERWHQPGLLVIGDAAHAMSPLGGVGINLAIQDAVAAANILWKPLRDGCVTDDNLSLVEARRRFPTWATQTLQTTAQNAVIDPVLTMTGTPAVPWPVRLAQRWPILQRIPARVIGMGFRPEHVESPTA